MLNPFDIYTISIVWDSPHTFRSYKLGTHPLKPTLSQNSNPEFDFVIYTKESADYYQFCIKTEGIPIIKSTDENNKWSLSNQLYKIDKDLWIIKGDWDIGQRGIGYHKCPSINTDGKLFIGITYDSKNIQQELTIDVNPNIEDFDFNNLKNDFEGELWDLLTLNKSKSNTQTNEIRYGDKVFLFAESKLIIDFLNEFQRIIKNPKRELKYTTTNQPYTKVKPVTETFKQLARSGISNTLPSKSYEEHFDIYENRYLCLMLYKISQIVNYNIFFSQQNSERLKSEIDSISTNISHLKEPPILNEQLLLKELELQKKIIQKRQQIWENSTQILQKNIQGNYTNERIKFLYENGGDSFWSVRGHNNIFCVIEFDEYVGEIFDINEEYDFSCILEYTHSISTRNRGYRPVYLIKSINSISPIRSKLLQETNVLAQQQKNFNILKENGFNQLSILNHSEKTKFKKERDNQIATLQRKIERIENQINNLLKFTNELIELKP